MYNFKTFNSIGQYLYKKTTMRSWALGLMSNDEKRSILDQHKSLYDGYRTMQPKVASEQPLYVQDFANDKGGITLSNKNNVTTYKNVGINESMMEEKSMCSECGGMMKEGECSECGWKGEMGEETQQVKDLKNVEDLNLSDKFDYVQEDDSLDALAMQDVTGQEAPHDATDMAPDGMDDDSDDNRKMMKDEEMKETQQGNPYDNEESAYNFVSDGPLQEYEPMESAFKDDDEEEIEIGSLDFPDDEDEEDEDEEEIKFDPKDKSWEEIKAHTGFWDEIDEDIKESVVIQKNRIVEMMERMKKF